MGNNKEQILRLLQQKQGQKTDKERILQMLEEKQAQKKQSSPVESAEPKQIGVSNNGLKFADAMQGYDSPAAAAGAQIGTWISNLLRGGKDDERTWFQKGAFEGGVTADNTVKGIQGTTTDAATDFGAGFLGYGEKTVDWIVGQAPNAIRTQAQGQYDSPAAAAGAALGRIIANIILGNDISYDPNREIADRAAAKAEKEAADFIKKDLYDEKKLANDIISRLGSAAFLAMKTQSGQQITQQDIEWANTMQQETLDYINGDMEKDSVLGDKSDSLMQSAGQLGATSLLSAMKVPWWVATGVASWGGEMENALNSGATLEQANVSGFISATAEVLTERISGGIKLPGMGKTLDDALTSTLAANISSKFWRTAAKLGIDVFGEGVEEWVTQDISTFGQWMTYQNEEDLWQLLTSEEAMDAKIEAFLGGMALGGAGSTTQSVIAKMNGVDYTTGLTKNEQAVVEKIYNDRVAEAEKNGELSGKKKTEIYDKVIKDVEKGRVDTDTIESVLGGDTYKGYQSMLEQEAALKDEIKTLVKTPKEQFTVEQSERLAEARKQLEGLDTKTAKAKLFDQVDKLTANDTKLRESYNERTRRGQAFTADLTKYDAKQQETVKKAIESGILNNSNRTHEFVDLIAKISANKGVSFNFADNAKLKESGFAIDGKQVNGFVTADGVTININSEKALNSVVGHEITHVLEGTELYNELESAITEYAKSKGDYQGRYDNLTELYKDIEGADIDAELTADLVGDYLFTDADFVKRLSTEHRGVFQKLFDEIKHLCKLATAGTKEARELEKVKKLFEDAYRTETKSPTVDGGVKYSIIALDNGNVYVKASRNVITGTTKTDQRKNITDFFNDLLEGNPSLDIQTIEGDTLTITKADTADKARDDYKTVQGKPVKMTDAEFLVKLRAEAHIDELAEISHKNNRPPVPDGKNHTFAKNGFTYRRAYFEDFDGQYYEITLSIGHNGTVATVYNVGKISKGALPSAKIIAVVGSKALGKTPSSFSLSTTPENVKDFFGDESKEDAPAGEYRITGEDIALAPTREDIAEQERIATAQTAPRNDAEELGAPTREDIARMEREKKLNGPLLMKDSLDRELEKLYRLQQTGKIQDDAYFLELSKVNEAYLSAGRDFSEALNRVVGAYQGDVETQATVAGEDTTAVNTNAVTRPLSSYPAEKQNTIRSYLQSVDEQIKAFVKRVKAGDLRFERKKVSDVNERAVSDISDLLGIDVSGYTHNINTSGVKHIINRHGVNGKQDSTMSMDEDIARVGWVLDNYDSVELLTKDGQQVYSSEFKDQDNNPVPQIRFVKKIDGTYYVVEAACENEYKKLWVQSAYLQKNEDVTQVSAEGQEANHKTYAQGELASPSSNNSIPEDVVGVKQKEVEAVLGEKDAYVSKQANALYDEVKSMQKGKRVSNTLSYLLDTLDLSEEHKADSYNSLRTALLNICDNPNQVVNPNSAVEAAARELLGREYDSMAEDYANAEGVAKSIYTKMESLRTELENNQSLREQSNADFDEEIARLQAEYEAKKNKNTKAANDLLRRIERTQRLKSQVDADYGKRIERLGERLEKISKPEYRTAMQRKAKMAEYTDLMAELVGDTSTWVDKKLGLSYSINTMRRNLRDIVRDSKGNRDIAKADAIYDELQGNYNHNEAELKRESARIKAVFQELGLNHAEDTYAHMLGEFQYNPDSQLSQEQLEEFYEKNKNRIDTQKVDKAIAEARKVFDDLIVRVNERLKEQGMKQIPYRKGYFPHFTNPKQTWLAKFFNWKPVDNEIPTSIAGLTEEFNPQKSWQSFDKQRTSDDTDYSLEQGLDSYIHGALDWIYHIEDIQKRRALENHIRYVHSDEGIKKRIDDIRNNESYDADEAQELIDAVYAEAKNPLNNFVSDLRTGTNTLANKKSSLDRKAEEMTNRKIYSVMTNLNSRINANMVVGSFSSALTNFIPITQSWMEVSPVYSLKGMRDTIKATIRDDGVVSKSDFLTNRLMNEEKLYQTGWDKVSEKAGFMMEAIDSFTSQTVWRSKYLQNMAEGMSEAEAIKNADQFAENVIAGRSRGNQPTIFDAKNPITKIFTAFQLEVANQYGYMFKDAPKDAKNKGRLIKGYATAFLGAYAYNALYSSLVGRDAAFDPLSILEDLFRDLFGDDEEEPEDAILNLADNILEEVPFIGGLVGGGRVPISSAIPYEGDYKTFITDLANGELSAKEMLKPIYYLAMPVAGGQIKKTNEGLKMFDKDLPVAGSYTESGNLRFPVEEDSIADWLQAALFGQYASKNAREYFDNGWAPLKEKQIEEFAALDIPIADYRQIRKQLGKLETIGEKFDYIDSLDLTVEQKNILVNNVVDRKEPVDMTNYGFFEDFDEFNFYIKNEEKYQFLKDNGIAYKTYNASEKSREAYSWAFQNPEKYQVSRAVAEDTVVYKGYAKALSKIEADKDSKGNAVSGSRKKKVVQYINGLDLEYGAKLVLYKMEYPSDDTYNGKIIEYVSGIEDFTFEQKANVLKELGFTVSTDGKVSWN